MTKPASVTFSPVKLPLEGVAVLLVPEGGGLSKTGKALDKKTGGLIAKAMKLKDFNGKARWFSYPSLSLFARNPPAPVHYGIEGRAPRCPGFAHRTRRASVDAPIV